MNFSNNEATKGGRLSPCEMPERGFSILAARVLEKMRQPRADERVIRVRF